MILSCLENGKIVTTPCNPNFDYFCNVLCVGAGSAGVYCADSAAREGANVVLADINPDSLDAAVEKVNAISEKVIGCVTDVTKYDQVEACIKKAKETFGSVDIVIPCAGGAETRILGVRSNFYDQPISVFDFGVD